MIDIYEIEKMHPLDRAANKMKLNEWQVMADHEYFGSIYCYPKCCITVYTTNMKNGIPNKLVAQLDHALHELYCPFHIPCSSKCIKSLELAKRYRTVLEKTDPEALAALERFSKLPLPWHLKSSN